MPENSLAAFRRAVSAGVDMLECDVRRAADGALVLLHEGRVVRDGRVVPVAALSLSDLRAAVPSLVAFPDFLAEFVPLLPINVDLKEVGWEAELVAELRRHDAVDRVLVSSKRAPSLRRLGGFEPRLALGLSRGHLASGAPTERGRAMAGMWLRATLPPLAVPSLRLARARALMLQHRAVGPLIVALLHRLGYRVFSWTVNSGVGAERMARAGVDGIASDDPACIMAELTAAGLR